MKFTSPVSISHRTPASRRGSRVTRLFFKDGEGDEDGGGSPPDPNQGGSSYNRGNPGNGLPEEDEQLGGAGKRALMRAKEEKRQLAQQLKDLQGKLQQFSDFEEGDLEELKSLKAEKVKTEEEKLKKQQHYEELLANRERKYKQDLDTLTQTANDYKSRYETLVMESAITEAFFESGGKRGDGEGMGPKAFAQLLIPQIKGQLRMEDSEIVVVDGQGDPRFNRDTGKDYTLLDLMQECRKGATGVLFESLNNSAGTGMNTSGRRRYTPNQMEELRSLSPAARIAEARRRGIA